MNCLLGNGFNDIRSNSRVANVNIDIFNSMKGRLKMGFFSLTKIKLFSSILILNDWSFYNQYVSLYFICF